ncbi:MAG: Protein of unknown function rane [Parcubacteria group bacterium]|nr:Protein of unknown function rane [Parcubacteria group bacterium]
MKLFKLFLIVLPFMAALDFSWAAFVANGFYSAQLGALISPHPIVWPLVAFYVMYSFAIAYFAVLPALRAHSLRLALMNGALLGLTAYGTYDLVNYGIVPGYSLAVTVVDIIWGIVVTKVVAAIAYGIGKKLVPLY